jgi:hypothetical protein
MFFVSTFPTELLIKVSFAPCQCKFKDAIILLALQTTYNQQTIWASSNYTNFSINLLMCEFEEHFLRFALQGSLDEVHLANLIREAWHPHSPS